MIINQKDDKQYTYIRIKTSLWIRISTLKNSSKFCWAVFLILFFITCYSLYFNSNYYLNIYLPILTCITAQAMIKEYENHYIICTLFLNIFFMTITLLWILSNAAIPIHLTKTIIRDLLLMVSIHSKCFVMAIIGVKIYITIKKRRFN